MKALIQGTRICEIATESFPVHKALIWADVADNTTTKDTYVDGAVVKFVPYVPTPQDEIRRIEAAIPARYVRDAAMGDAYAIGKLEDIEALLNIQRAKL